MAEDEASAADVAGWFAMGAGRGILVAAVPVLAVSLAVAAAIWLIRMPLTMIGDS